MPRFAIGDRVVGTGSSRHGVVVNVRDEWFPTGGVQQVLGVRWGDGTGTTMRAAHFTHDPTVSDHTEGSTT